MSTPGVCEHCACGSAIRVDSRRGTVMRRLAGNDPAVNEEWIDDKSRFAFRYLTSKGRITRPMVRGSDGVLAEASWTDALRVAAEGLLAARNAGGAPDDTARGEGGIGVLAGGRLTVEDAYAYAKFARVAAGTNDVDFRARPHSAEELDFLAAHVVGQGPERLSYTRLEAAPAVLCVALEPEEEAPIVFLRLRKAAQKHRQKVFHLGQWTTPAVLRTAVERGTTEPAARDGLIRAVPGAEAAVLADLANVAPHVVEALTGGGVILVGERAAEVPGLFTRRRPARRAHRRRRRLGAAAGGGARRGRGGRAAHAAAGRSPVADDAARAEVERAWGLADGTLPTTPGRSTSEMLDARPRRASSRRWSSAGSTRTTCRTRRRAAGPARGRVPGQPGDAHLARSRSWPTSCSRWRPDAQRSGSYVNWEGRRCGFGPALDASGVLPDCRVLDTLAVEMDVDLFTQTPAAAAGELARSGAYTGVASAPAVGAAGRAAAARRSSGRRCSPPGGS